MTLFVVDAREMFENGHAVMRALGVGADTPIKPEVARQRDIKGAAATLVALLVHLVFLGSGFRE
jgi:hypothetical protein